MLNPILNPILNLQEPKKGRKNKRRRKYAPIREEWGKVPMTTREEIGVEGGAEHLAVGSNGDKEEGEGSSCYNLAPQRKERRWGRF